MYNAMIHPLVPFAVRGVIWYQGESNLTDGKLYCDKMQGLIEGWRQAWDNDAISFYWAQLAPYIYYRDPHFLPRIWEAQTAAMKIPRTGMAVLTDIGDLRDIHPRNKKDVGERLALWALARDYGKNVVCSGPLFKAMKIEGKVIRVSFDHTGSGLRSRDGRPLTHFEIGCDGKFVPARAVIDGKTVVVSSDAITRPTAARFAWHERAAPNLCNKEGLPAGPFRTYSSAPTIAGPSLFVNKASIVFDCIETEGVIRYTLDGATPTQKSLAYRKAITVTDTTTVRARFYRVGGAKSAVVQQTFTRVEPRKHEGVTLVPGLRYDYYEGEWDTLPDFARLTPVASGVVDGLTLAPRRNHNKFGFRFTGYLDVRTAGRYTFHLGSDDGSRLTVDGKVVVDNDGLHSFVRRSGAVDLEPGMHEVVITFFERTGGQALTATYQGPDMPRGPIPFWRVR